MPETFQFPLPVQPSLRGAVPAFPGLHARQARQGDIPFLQRLYRSSRDRELAGLPWPEEMKRDFCRSQFAAQHLDYTTRHPLAWFLILEQKRVPFGRLYVDLSGSAVHLIDICLLAGHQGQGIGSTILGALQQHAQREGKPLHLSVERGNHRAASLYRRLGFAQQGVTDTHFSLSWEAT